MSMHGSGNWLIERAGENPVVLFHVPHAGTVIPDDVRDGIVLDDESLAHELLVMTDWHTDEIARGAASACGMSSVSFMNRMSRLVVDPERFPDDSEPMAEVGMGAVYVSTSDGGILRESDDVRDAHLRATYFDPYSLAIADLVDDVLTSSGSVMIIDVHSYSSTALPYERNPSGERPGVCIGVDGFHTPEWLIESALTVFDGVQGGAGINTPFAGTYVPLRHFEQDSRVRSVMVEIRRDIYMDESVATLHAGFEDIVARLSRFAATSKEPDLPKRHDGP